MQINLFENTFLSRDIVRLREQIASRSGYIKNTPNYVNHIHNVKLEGSNCDNVLLQEYDFLCDRDMYSIDRYYNDNGVIADRLIETEVSGFFDDDSTPPYTSILRLDGITPAILSILTGCNLDKIRFSESQHLHAKFLERFNGDCTANLKEFPLVGAEPYVDLYFVEKYQDICLNTGTSGVKTIYEARKEVNHSILQKMISVGLYAAQYAVKNIDSGKTFLRTFKPNMYIIKSEGILNIPVDLYYGGRKIFTTSISSVERRTVGSGGSTRGDKVGFNRSSKAS